MNEREVMDLVVGLSILLILLTWPWVSRAGRFMALIIVLAGVLILRSI